MAIISQKDEDLQQFAQSVSVFLRTFHIANLLRVAGAMKEKGVSIAEISEVTNVPLQVVAAMPAV